MNEQPSTEVREAFARGIEHFNRAEFFQAHEELEDAWRASSGPQRLFLQGMTQAAVALHHRSTGNRDGATSVLARALRNLESYPADFGGIDLLRLRADLKDIHTRLLEGAAPDVLPRILLAGSGAERPRESR